MKKNTISRRRFLSLMSKAVCAGAVVGMAPVAYSTYALRNAALIGYGQRGAGFWQQEILPHLADKVRLSTICEPNPAIRKQIQNDGPYQVLRNSRELVSNPGIDTLIITAPDNWHTPLIQDFMASKKQLVCELPLAISRNQYQQLRRLREAGASTINPVLTERLRPVWKRVKTLIEQNVIGDVLAVDFHVYRSQTNASQIFRSWKGQPDITGSWLIHEGTQHFDLVNWWLGLEPVAVSASGKIQEPNSENSYHTTPGRTIRPNPKNWNSYSVQVKYEDNVFLNYSLNGAMSYDGCHLVINGVKGQIESWLFNQNQAQHQGLRIWNSNGKRRQLWEKTTAMPEKLAPELWDQCTASNGTAFKSSLAANLITIEATNSIIQHQPIRLQHQTPYFRTTEFRSESA